MSRAVFLNMSERAIILHCEEQKVGISAIGRLPTGGTRLVCMSSRGAEQIRRKLKARLIKGLTQERHGPGSGFVARN